MRVLGVSILCGSTILQLNFGTVLTVLYLFTFHFISDAGLQLASNSWEVTFRRQTLKSR